MNFADGIIANDASMLNDKKSEHKLELKKDMLKKFCNFKIDLILGYTEPDELLKECLGELISDRIFMDDDEFWEKYS